MNFNQHLEAELARLAKIQTINSIFVGMGDEAAAVRAYDLLTEAEEGDWRGILEAAGLEDVVIEEDCDDPLCELQTVLERRYDWYRGFLNQAASAAITLST